MALNQLFRYSKIVKLIKKENPKTILEIGSGTQGIGKYISRKFVGCDINLSDIEIGKSIPSKNSSLIKGSALCLPFKDNVFQLVISLDMLEHIKLDEREQTIKEAYRVAKEKVIFAFPCGESAIKYDKKIKKWFDLIKKSQRFWLLEHIEKKLPLKEDIIEILNRNRMSFKILSNENILLHYLVIILESIPVINIYLAQISEAISAEKYKKRDYSFKRKVVRRIFYPIKFFLPLFDFGKSYRKVFIIEKNAGHGCEFRKLKIKPLC